MSILSTDKKLIRVGAEYSAGPNIDIQDCVISGKDWTDDIANASANAYNEATAQIPDPFDPSYLSAQIDNKLNSSDFTTWQNGQYTTDLQTIEGQINNKLDTSSFSDVSGSFLTAHQSLDGYATEDWVTAQGYITGVDLSNYYTKDETSGKEELAQAFADIPVGDPEVNAYVTDNSATINGTTDLVQNSSGLWNDVAVYQSNSANYLTAHQDISYKLDESAFADVSGTFLTAHQDLSNYYTTAEADSLSSMFSGAIDYVSANAGDPNALTGYQEDGCEISATSSFFGAKGDAGYVISTDTGIFEAKGQGYDLLVGYGGHLSATNLCSAIFTNGSKFINTNANFISADGSNGFVTSSNYHDLRIERAGKISANNNASAVFTNGSLVSADSMYGFLVSAGYDRFISAAPWGLQTKNGSYDIKADYNGLDISAYSNIPFKYRTSYHNITMGGSSYFAFDDSTIYYSAWIDHHGAYGLSGTGWIGSFGGWQGREVNPIANHYINGVGFSGGSCNFGVYDGGTLIANNYGILSATNGASAMFSNACSAVFTNGSRTEITNGHTLLVGNNELGTMNGILVSSNGIPYISIFQGGRVKVIDGNEVSLSSITHKIGTSLNASGSQFVSADGEGVSAWKPAAMTVMGAYNQTSSNAAFVIGNGSGYTARSDLFVIDYSGNAQTNDFIAGNGAKLSDSIQTSELEFNADNAITAIAGSAIGGGGGVTGEFVPQSAFDELKQSYDALSSLFATYSGQWLLPNEGEE